MIRPVLCPSVMFREESILRIEGNWPDGSFDGIVVDLDATVGQIDEKASQYFAI